jgi:regulator of extracellular matrix RemA (YlzA/DUF370 family)
MGVLEVATVIIPIEHENFLNAEGVVVILRPDSSPARALRHEAERSGKLINATRGRKARSVIVMKDNHVVLSSLEPTAIRKRFDRLMRILDKDKQDPQSSLFEEHHE